MFRYQYRLFLIAVVLLFLKCCECTFPYLIGEHRSGGGVPVFVSVRVNDKVFFSTSGEHEIAQLRNKLQSIYPVKTPGLLSLSVNTISFDLISSPVLISKNFTVNYKAKHVKQNKRFTAQRHDYHPYCNYVASSDAVFNLCSGVNGHFTDDDKYYKIKSNVSKGTVTHFSNVSPSTHVPSLHDRDKRSYLYEGQQSDRAFERYKRAEPTMYYFEVYIVADYDYYNHVCEKNETYCIDKIWSYSLHTAFLFRQNFDIHLVVIKIDVWTEENLIDIPINKKASYRDDVSGWFSAEIGNYTYYELGGANAYDGFLYIASTTHKLYGDILGLARLDRACLNDSFAYVEINAGDRFEKGIDTITHELTHVLGGEHISDYDTFYKCWCFPKHCVMGRG